jgi:ribosomal protein L15
MQRLPKLHGFKSHKPEIENVYTGQLADLKAKVIDNFALAEAGLVTNPYVKVKLIVKGEVAKAHAVKLQGASENAIAALQKSGGSFEAVPQVGRSKQEKKEKK